MKTIQVYGSGCRNCQVTAQRIVDVAHSLGQDVEVEKVTSLEAIMKAGVMSTLEWELKVSFATQDQCQLWNKSKPCWCRNGIEYSALLGLPGGVVD